MTAAPRRGRHQFSDAQDPDFEPGEMPDLESYECEDDAPTFADEFDPEDFLDG